MEAKGITTDRRFTVNEDGEVVDRAILSPSLSFYLKDDILMKLSVLIERADVMHIPSRIITYKNSLKTMYINNVTYIINTDKYDPSLVRLLGKLMIDKESLHPKLLKAIKL